MNTPATKLLAELGRLRLEVARLFGARSYADFTLRRRMAQTAARANRFLAEVQQAVGERERAEVADMRAAKAQALGKPLVFVVNAASPRARITAEAVIALSQHGTLAPTIIHHRTDFAASMIDGRTVMELDGK